MIYIAAHKKVKINQMEQYALLQVGAEGKEDLGYLKDNEGENISMKNPNFCELTGIYWIWKNSSDHYKGLVHYRRFLGKSNLSSNFNKVYSYDQLVNFLSDVDIVLPYRESFLQSAKEEILLQCCTPEIYEKMRDIVQKKYPEYIPDFDAFFAQNQSTLFNMMFCKSELFDKYCEWLFDILFELERNITLDGLNDYQKRLHGFLSERLLNVWVLHNKLKVKNVAVINTESTFKDRLKLIRRRFTNKIRYNLKK